jgi:SpoIID/LytB domain protein
MNQSDRSYRGTIEINAAKNGLTLINIVNLEEYLYSVLPSEMPANWPKEAQKAQAIAGRSEAMKKLGRHKDDGFDFCAEVHCQAYSGVEQETDQTNRAVDETRGLIIVYKNEPIDALYSSNCGGHTQDNIFGNSKEIPYLKGRPDILDEKGSNFPLPPLEFEYWLTQPPQGILCDTSEYSPRSCTQGRGSRNSSFRWVRIYNYDEIKEMLAKFTDFGQIQKIIVTKRNKSGHVTEVKIIGSNTAYILEKELNIRSALGNLRSSMFKVETKNDYNGKPEQFIFYGGGFGHGVGMCQSGAYGLANLGKNYKEILNHYFGAIEFKKVY